MKTEFTEAQLQDAATRRSNAILRSCVHCGFCTATCPTYRVLGDECDSPRGRIYMIKNMLEQGDPPDSKTVTHIDRCLSCLGCMTTCPSGVNYMHLVDHAREFIEDNYRRPVADRVIRWFLRKTLPYPTRFRLVLLLARLGRPFRFLVPGRRLRDMMNLAPGRIPPVSRNDDPQVFPALGRRDLRVVLMTGCAQRALDTDINDASIRFLRRHGCEVVIPGGSGCCGALEHHMGRVADGRKKAASNIRSWIAEFKKGGLDAIVINASGCGTTIKDYGHLFHDTELADDAARVAALAKDISEFATEHDLLSRAGPGGKGTRVAYHSACSLQHGQKVREEPKVLLETAGFEVCEPANAHMCCGSAGTYNLLQPEISRKLRDLKVDTLAATNPEVIAAGNVGCMVQIGSGLPVPVVHTVELLDWATGGPRPRKMSDRTQLHPG